MPENSPEGKLPLLQRFAFGTGHMLNVLAVAGMWFPYGLAFFKQVLQIPHASVGHIFIIAQVAGAVFMPFVGMWSDQCVCKYGRRKIFHLVGLIAFFCSFFFVWHECFGCAGVPDNYKVLYYSSFAIVFQFGWAATQIAQLALVPELTSDKNVKVELNSIRYGFQVAGNLLVFVIFWILLVKVNRSVNTANLEPSDERVFWIMAIIVTVLGLLFALPFQFFIREKPTKSLEKLKWYKWFMNPRFYLVICVFVASKIITILTQQYFPLYFLNTLKMNETSIAIGPLVLYISSVIMTIFVKFLNKKLGEKIMYISGTVVVWGSLVWLLLKHPTNDSTSSFNWSRDSIYIAIILLGFGGATLMVISLSMIALLVGKYSGSAAFVYGWVMFADRFSNGALNEVIQQFSPADSNPGSLALYYREAMVYTPFAATVLGLGAIAIISVLDGWKWWKAKKEKTAAMTAVQVLPSNTGNIQTGAGENEVNHYADTDGNEDSLLSKRVENTFDRELEYTLST